MVHRSHWIIQYLILAVVMTATALPYYDDYFLPEVVQKEKEAVANDKANPPEYDEVQDTEKPLGFTCGLCIVVDEEFSQAYNIKDEVALKTSMQRLVDHASWIFRASDWDGDGTPDNIGLKIKKISFGWRPFKHETTKHYQTPKNALELLKIFSRLNFNTCCLGVGFTYRPFLNSMDGIAFGASDRLIGGICDHRNPREEYMKNMNTILISGRGLNRTQLTSFQIAKALIHELGHSFGVHAHDNDYKDFECWGFSSSEEAKKPRAKPTDGRYIMWSRSPAYATSGFSKNSLRFSRCSSAAITAIVSKRKNRQKCFELEYNPYCGNGIIEGVELCDCGNEFDCSKQKCCGSRKSQKPCMVEDVKSCPPAVISRLGSKASEMMNSTSTMITAKGKHFISWTSFILLVAGFAF